MNGGSKKVSAEDAALFREAIGAVRRLQGAAAAPAPSLRPAPEPVQRRADEAEALRQSRDGSAAQAVDAVDSPGYRRPEVPARVLRRLRRGEYAVQDEIDLHHLAADEAEALLRQFLREAVDQRRRCVRVIHGKGLRSKGGVPVLKAMVERVLPRREDVLAYALAPPAQGGSGAVLVLLAARRS